MSIQDRRIHTIAQMNLGQLARCNFCNNYETNKIRAMHEHINSKHYRISLPTDAIDYVTLTGKTATPEQELAYTPTVGEMLFEVNRCRLSEYDINFISSLTAAYYQYSRLTEKQQLALAKVYHRYRRQISINRKQEAKVEALSNLDTVKRYARYFARTLQEKEILTTQDHEWLEMCSQIILSGGGQYRRYIALSKVVVAQ